MVLVQVLGDEGLMVVAAAAAAAAAARTSIWFHLPDGGFV